MGSILEIVGVFLFVGGFMYLILSGRLVDMFRNREPKPILLILLITGFAFYHWGTLLMAPDTDSGTSAQPEPRAAAVPEPEPPRPVTARHRAKAPTPAPASKPARAAEPEHWETIIVKEGTPEQVVVPQAADPAPATASAPAVSAEPPADGPSSDPYESKAKRGIKALGRFLHLRKKDQ